jgi:hypothetical protein
MSTPIAPISATIVTLLALGGAIAVASGDAPAQGNGAMPLAAAVEGAVAAADVEMTQTVFKATAPLAAGGIAASEGDGRSIYLFHRSPIERQILSTLETPLTDPLDFNATPLNQVMGAVSENYGLQIVFDTVALDAVAISPDTEVTTSLHDVPLRSALRLILKQIPGLTYIVKHDVLLITTQEEANSTLVTHIYDLSNLAKDVDADQLVEVIPEVVAFDSWQVNGSGEGTIRPLDKRMFVVNQTYEVHEAILALLEQMQAPKGPVGGE